MLREKEYTVNMNIFDSIYVTNDEEIKKTDNRFKSLIIYKNYIEEYDENGYESPIIEKNEVKQAQKIQKNKILNMIKESESEWGCYSEFEEFVIKNKRDKFLINMINQIFVDNISDEEVIVKILRAFSRLTYEDTYPNAQTMCLAAISINNIEVKEAAIEVFEAWRNREALKLLQIIDLKEDWLKKYCNKVINEIKEELENV
jgi:hypothetical protein